MGNYSEPLDQIFHALADSTRRGVVEQLLQGPASVKELAEPFDMALPSFLKHIAVLEESTLITTRKVGRVRTCELSTEAMKTAESWLADARAFWDQRLDALVAYVESNQTNSHKTGVTDDNSTTGDD